LPRSPAATRILNSGHTKAGANVIRNIDYKPRRFSTWAPKALATIRTVADTLEDRAIVVQLQRKPPTATVAPLRRRAIELNSDQNQCGGSCQQEGPPI